LSPYARTHLRRTLFLAPVENRHIKDCQRDAWLRNAEDASFSETLGARARRQHHHPGEAPGLEISSRTRRNLSAQRRRHLRHLDPSWESPRLLRKNGGGGGKRKTRKTFFASLGSAVTDLFGRLGLLRRREERREGVEGRGGGGRMGRMGRICLQSFLKLVNSVIGMVGVGMILYAMWMLRVWYRQMNGDWRGPDSSAPWFIFTFLGLGISLCVITCSGHIAAETANGHCLSCVSFSPIHYMVLVFLLVLLEASITADVFLNRSWEEDFPEDPTGRFDELKDFVRSNFEMCKWIGLMIVGAQALSILLAMVLRALGPDREGDYDSDDDYIPTRLPLLRNHQNPSYAHVDSHAKNENWSLKIHEKVIYYLKLA
ncbi:hypothetical protein Taro_021191, partial [Colocasia esculenta]|nr:hypothetical protein [Colocasia esculenta]